MKLFEKLTAEQEKYLAKLLSKTEAKVTDIYRAALIELKAELLDLASRYNQKGFLVQSEMNRFQRYSSMMGTLRGKIADSMSLAHSEMKKTVVETYLETRGMTAYAMEQTAGGTLGFGRVDPKDLEKAVNDKYSKLADSKALEGDKKKAFATVKNQINVSMAKGEDVGTTANRVAEVLGFKDKDGTFLPNGRGELYKAMRIARTETHRVQSQGQVDTINEAKDLGVDVVMVWDAALDDRTRDTHGEMDGQIADEEGNFTLPGGGITKGPGMSGIASEDINCRCVARPQVKGFPPSMRRVGDGKEPWQTYKEWKAGQAEKDSPQPKDPEVQDNKPKDPPKEEPQKPENRDNTPDPDQKAPLFPEYEDQTTVKNAESWALKNNMADIVSFKGANVDVVNGWNRVIFEHLNEFPELRATFQFVGTTQERQRKYVELRTKELVQDPFMKNIYGGNEEALKKRAMDKARKEAGKTPAGVIAYSIKNRLTSGICINSKYASSGVAIDEVVARGVATGHFPAGAKGIRHIVSHELGHELDKLLGLRARPELREIIRGLNIRTELSGYATTNLAEVIAEAWGEYKSSPNPRMLSRNVAELIYKVYNEIYGGKK